MGRAIRPRGRIGHRAAAAALAAVAVAALPGCAAVATTVSTYSATENRTITEIVITGGAGDVLFRPGLESTVRVDRSARYRGAEPGRTYRIEGTVLHVDTDCGRSCEMSYTITGAGGVAVRGENGSGDVTLTGVSTVDLTVGAGSVSVTDAAGDVAVETGAGDITVRGVAGAFRAEAGAGSVEARALRGRVQAHSGAGHLTLDLERAADVRAEADAGDLDLRVPAGRYRVAANSGAGDEVVQIPNDPAGTHTLTLDTGSGDISVTQG